MKTFSYTNRFHTDIFVSSADNFVMCALRRILVKGLSSYFRWSDRHTRLSWLTYHQPNIDEKTRLPLTRTWTKLQWVAPRWNEGRTVNSSSHYLRYNWSSDGAIPVLPKLASRHRLPQRVQLVGWNLVTSFESQKHSLPLPNMYVEVSETCLTHWHLSENRQFVSGNPRSIIELGPSLSHKIPSPID